MTHFQQIAATAATDELIAQYNQMFEQDLNPETVRQFLAIALERKQLETELAKRQEFERRISSLYADIQRTLDYFGAPTVTPEEITGLQSAVYAIRDALPSLPEPTFPRPE